MTEMMIITRGLCYTPKKELYGIYVSSLRTFVRPRSWLLDTDRSGNYQGANEQLVQISIPNFFYYHLSYVSCESIKTMWNCRALDLHPGNIHLKRTLGTGKENLNLPATAVSITPTYIQWF